MTIVRIDSWVSVVVVVVGGLAVVATVNTKYLLYMIVNNADG